MSGYMYSTYLFSVIAFEKFPVQLQSTRSSIIRIRVFNAHTHLYIMWFYNVIYFVNICIGLWFDILM